MADVDDKLARLEQALEIYGRVIALMKDDEPNAVLLDDAAKRMRWAIKELARQVWLLSKD